ncbi:NUDIX domain-containing protein [Lederbergia graminis]|uniref:NUDIX domain-containing protein n=1 Tax=Lederbergia graminis TaxID=735518 RepID=A0ABW0LJE7_9BACI
MSRPLLRAEGIIINENRTEILVQCDVDERFYRLPGGTIELEETAEEAIKRELIEEFELSVDIGELACVNESIIQYDGRKQHHCTLIHWCSIHEKIEHDLIHNENPNVKLVWRTISQLSERPFYPEGILDVVVENSNNISHIKIRKNYD